MHLLWSWRDVEDRSIDVQQDGETVQFVGM
jgi:hypothetical protein